MKFSKINCSNLLLVINFYFYLALCFEHGEKFACVDETLIKRHQLNRQIYRDCNKHRNVTYLYYQPHNNHRFRRRVDTTFHGNMRPRYEVLNTKFHMAAYNFDQTNSLVALVNKIALEYLAKCPPVIYYDRYVEKSDGLILETLFKTFPITFYHGEINERYQALNRKFRLRIDQQCKSYILFLSDPLMARNILGPQLDSRVVLIARSTQWKLRDFLSSEKSSNIVNLLVIGESLTADPAKERPYVLYTHKLYADGLGSNTPVVLTSWIKGALTRPHINLFPNKFESGFAGHRFLVSSVNQPPFVFSIKSLGMGGTTNTRWDGIEYRLLNMISKKLNFSIELAEPPRRFDTKGSIEAIQWQISKKISDIGMSGVFITEDRMYETDMSYGHSRDCAGFVTLASKALPKSRAIMGPFQWPVWVALTCVYLGAIFPIVYTDRLTLSHLIGNWGEIENMFWYVFGMFTNSLTFSGKYSWSSSKNVSTRILIGSYWIFTIIITACYTGSIIAFVTLPAFPDTVDSVTDLLGLFFRVATLDNGGWENWFQNSTHVPTAKLYRKMEFVSTLEEGVGNVTQSFFWNYAFLGSKSQLEYMIQANFSDENISRRSALHLSQECFALFQVGFMFPRDAVYKRKINSMILLAQQSGLINKIEDEVRWTMQRSATGKLLQASSSISLRDRIQEERQLTTADTEGMFLLMGIGYALGAIALLSEIVGGITNKCRQIIKRSRNSYSSTWSSGRNSADDNNAARTEAEQKAHDKRKDARRRANEEAEEESRKHARFGMREFNLTRATLKELYGNYNRQEPNYTVRDGKLVLETEDVSVGSTINGDSRDSSGDLLLPSMRIRTKALILADVETGSSDIINDDRVAHNIDQTDKKRTSLANLEKFLESHICADIAEQENETTIDDNDDIVFGPPNEHELFGSFIEVPTSMETAETSRFDNLNLFSLEKDYPLVEKELNEMKSKKQ